MELAGAKITLSLVMAGSGALLIYIARATASGRVGRNALAGIRTRSTMASDDAWLAAHRAGRSMTEAGGWCALATGGLVLLTGSEIQLGVVCGTGAVVMLAFVIWGGVRGDRAAKRVDE